MRAACPKDKLEFNFLSSGTAVCRKKCFKQGVINLGNSFMNLELS